MLKQNPSAAQLKKQLTAAKDRAEEAVYELRTERKALSKALTVIRNSTGWKALTLDELLVKISRMNTEEISAPKLEAELDIKKGFFFQVRNRTGGQQRSYADVLKLIDSTFEQAAQEGFRELLLDIQRKVDHIDDFCTASAGLHPHLFDQEDGREAGVPGLHAPTTDRKDNNNG